MISNDELDKLEKKPVMAIDVVALIDELRQQNNRINAVKKAIANPGPNPRYHAMCQKSHRREWPMLWAAIDELLR